MSRRSNIEELLTILDRRQHKWKLVEGKMGIHTPPYVLTEIEDLSQEMQSLRTELAFLDVPVPTREQALAIPQRSRSKEQIRQQILWVLYDGYERAIDAIEQQELADLLNLPPEKLRANLNILAAQGWVEIDDTNSRGSRVFRFIRLTPKGAVYVEDRHPLA